MPSRTNNHEDAKVTNLEQSGFERLFGLLLKSFFYIYFRSFYKRLPTLINILWTNLFSILLSEGLYRAVNIFSLFSFLDVTTD